MKVACKECLVLVRCRGRLSITELIKECPLLRKSITSSELIDEAVEVLKPYWLDHSKPNEIAFNIRTIKKNFNDMKRGDF
jgi:hypothetical protein